MSPASSLQKPLLLIALLLVIDLASISQLGARAMRIYPTYAAPAGAHRNPESAGRERQQQRQAQREQPGATAAAMAAAVAAMALHRQGAVGAHHLNRDDNRQGIGDHGFGPRHAAAKCSGSSPSSPSSSSSSSSAEDVDCSRSPAPEEAEGSEIDPRYGVEKRLVPTGPNPLHN